MGAKPKEWFLRMKQEDFFNLTPEVRAKFTYSECREANEYEENIDDITYIRLKSEEKKAKKAVQDYLFKKRHKL